MMKPTVAQTYVVLIQDENQHEVQSTYVFLFESASMHAKNGNRGTILR